METTERELLRDEALRHVHDNVVYAAPWPDSEIEFESPRKAKRYARRHAREIAGNWDY